MTKYRLIFSDGRYRVQHRGLNTFGIWQQVDYFYSGQEAEKCFEETVKNGNKKVIKEI